MQSLESFNCNPLLNIIAQNFSFELFKTSQIKYYKNYIFIFHIPLPFYFPMLPSCIENYPAIIFFFWTHIFKNSFSEGILRVNSVSAYLSLILVLERWFCWEHKRSRWIKTQS